MTRTVLDPRSTSALRAATLSAARPIAALLAALAALAGLGAPPPASAQETGLTLGRAQELAVATDARYVQGALNDSAAALRVDRLGSGYLPRLTIRGEAGVQSDVTQFAPTGETPPGLTFPEPPKRRFEVALRADQSIYDAGEIAGSRDVERARLAERQARLAASLYDLRSEVATAFFAVLTLDARLDEQDALIADLDARLSEARARVAEGAALPGDAALIEAERLRAGQRREELASSRRAALEVLGRLTAGRIVDSADLVVPELDAPFDSVRAALASGLPGVAAGHPRVQALRSAGVRAGEEADLAGRGSYPRLAAFGEVGAGDPGLNLVNEDGWDAFWRAGLRFEWTPWDWGAVDQARQLFALERRTLSSEADAVEDLLERAAVRDIEDVARLDAAIRTDARIIELREQVERQARRQYEEGVLPAAHYVDRRTDLHVARVALRLHRLQRVEAEARVLTILGIDLP